MHVISTSLSSTTAQVLGLPLTCRYCQGVPSGHALAGVPSLSQDYDCACLHMRTVSCLYR